MQDGMSYDQRVDAALEDMRESHAAWVENVEALRRIAFSGRRSAASREVAEITNDVVTFGEAYRRAWDRLQSILGELH